MKPPTSAMLAPFLDRSNSSVFLKKIGQPDSSSPLNVWSAHSRHSLLCPPPLHNEKLQGGQLDLTSKVVEAEAMVRQALFLAIFVLPWQDITVVAKGTTHADGFVRIDGTRFVVNGSTLYFSGFNAYWMMLIASDVSQRGKVTAAFHQASEHGLNLARAWAFSDGGAQPLQSSPGTYNEVMFQGLDFAIAEARKHGIYLLLCLTNNFYNFGGKGQYVQWAKQRGHNLSTEDDFFTSSIVKGYYKNHVKTILTRVNTLTGVAYKDDPAIFAWELMNEPRCQADPSGAMVQAWIEEMAAYLKTIDDAHLVTAGLEGFYGEGLHEKKELNPWSIFYGTNFIASHQIQGIDFATIHLYPNVWLWGSTNQVQLNFFENWTRAHIKDTEAFLKKPLLLTEYGKFRWKGGSNITQRDNFLRIVSDSIYASAANGGPLVGGAFWQLLDDGMDTLKDGYEIILHKDPLAAGIISNHSLQLSKLSGEDVEGYRTGTSHRKTHTRHSGRDNTAHVPIPFIHFFSLFRSIRSLFNSA